MRIAVIVYGDYIVCKYTYNSLRQTDVVSGRLGFRLVRSSRVPEYTQLLHALVTALAETSDLDPVRADRLVCVDDKVVSLT